MSKLVPRLALVVFALALAGPEARAQYVRRTAIVEAVAQTREGIVTLKVFKEGSYGKSELVGTGVIVDERGYAITNNHVVANATRIVATLPDKTRVEATVHARVPQNDLAILRLPVKKNVKALRFASGSDLLVGETVIAVGNPFGFAGTVSTGIISALGRDIPVGSGDLTLTGLIQHSASINPGNSGGPLLNVNGELIGINVALRDGAQGIAFALNAETVKEVLASRLSASRVSKVSHGLTLAEAVAPEGANRQKVVVEKVALPSRAGLKRGDVIVKFGTLAPANRFDVERALWGYKAGDKVHVTVLRDGKPTTVEITLAGSESTRVTSASHGR
jgi:serine protease Do